LSLHDPHGERPSQKSFLREHFVERVISNVQDLATSFGIPSSPEYMSASVVLVSRRDPLV
jgi:hypothetical protein